MQTSAAKIPFWITGGTAVAAYLFALLTITALSTTDEFWKTLLSTSRFRSGLLFYSSPFLLLGAIMVATGNWVPYRVSLLILRRIILGVCVVSLPLTGILLIVFAQAFDSKMSV